MASLRSFTSAFSSMRAAASNSVENSLQNLVQPVNGFVSRPPFSKGRLRITLATWLFKTCAGFCVVSVLTYRSAQIKISAPRSSGSDTGDKVKSGCTETTQYPVTVRIPWYDERFIEVTLLGPKYRDVQALQKTFASMECSLKVGDNQGEMFYKVYGYGLSQSNPADYRRTCQAPDSHVKVAHIKMSYETGPAKFLSLFHAVRSVRRLENRRLPANVPDFVVTTIVVELARLDQRGNFLASSDFELALEDGRRYVVTFSMPCTGNLPIRKRINRWCSRGAPFLKMRDGQEVTSANFPDDRPIDWNDPAVGHFNRTLHRVLSHSLLKTTVQSWNRMRRKGDALPQLRAPLTSFCRRELISLGSLLADRVPNRTSDQAIGELALNVSETRVYEVTCDQTEFAGVVTWLALAWPFFTVWMSMSRIIIPIIYKHSATFSRISGVSAKKDAVIEPETSPSVVVINHLEAEQPRRELSDRKAVGMSSCGSAKKVDDFGEKLHVDGNMSEDVDRDCNRCTDQDSAKPFAGDGAVASHWDASRELVFPELMDLLHCLVDAAVSKHVERIRNEVMVRGIAESRMPARDDQLDGCPSTTLEEGNATQYGSDQCDTAANGGPRVVHNIASIVEDVQECRVSIATLSSHCCKLETMLRRTATWNTATEGDAHGVVAGECTSGDTSQGNSLLRGSAGDPLLMAEASTRSAITLLISRLEQRLATLARCTAVDTVSRYQDQLREDRQLRAVFVPCGQRTYL